MPQKAHLNGSKGDPQKAFFDPKNVIFPIFQFWPLGGPWDRKPRNDSLVALNL